MSAARRAAEECGAEIIVIKKTSAEYSLEKDPPPCPSVAVNDLFLVKDGTVTFDELTNALAGNR